QLILRIVKLSVVWGLANAVMAIFVPAVFGSLFTKDEAVRSAVMRVAPLLGAGLLGHCTTLSLEGVLLATGRGRWLAGLYWVNTAVFVPAIIYGGCMHPNLSFVWGAMVTFQLIRLVQFCTRVWIDHWGQ
ncbi:unnamed protein product, partial [Polarella glacialis]